VVVRGGIVGTTVGMTGATIAPTGMTGIEIRTKTEIGIGTGIEMTTETEGTHGETGRIWNEIEMICGRTT
jgi:hypothetical protein